MIILHCLPPNHFQSLLMEAYIYMRIRPAPRAGLLSVCDVVTLNRPFYSASSVHPVPVQIPYPRETPGTNSVVTNCETEKDQVKCQRIEYKDTTTQARPENKNNRTIIQKQILR